MDCQIPNHYCETVYSRYSTDYSDVISATESSFGPFQSMKIVQSVGCATALVDVIAATFARVNDGGEVNADVNADVGDDGDGDDVNGVGKIGLRRLYVAFVLCCEDGKIHC